MKKSWYAELVEEVVQVKMQAIDDFIEEVIDPLGDIGSPEKLIGKKYEDWTPLDLQLLGQVYGPEPNALSELIFRKEYERVKKLEAENA